MTSVNEVLVMADLRTAGCAKCGLDIEQLRARDGGKPFLIAVKDDMYCGQCAVVLLMPKQCANDECKKMNDGAANFCGFCGGKL